MKILICCKQPMKCVENNFNGIVFVCFKCEKVLFHNHKIIRNITDEIHIIFGKWFKNEWQKDFLCPVCDQNTLDLGVKSKVGHPIVCTYCETLFDIIKTKKI